MTEEILSPVSTRRTGSTAADGAEEGKEGRYWEIGEGRGKEGLVVG